MDIKRVVTKRSDCDEGDILSAIWHWMVFMAVRCFTGSVEISFRKGVVTDLKEDGSSVGIGVREINKRIRLGRCESEEQKD